MSPCIAYQDEGRLCRAPAAILDHQRGGMVCLQHVPDDVAAEITLYIKMGTVEGRIDKRAYRSWGYAARASSCWTGKLGYQWRNTVANSWFRVLTRIWSSRCAARLVHWLGKGRAQCLCLFLHPPR